MYEEHAESTPLLSRQNIHHSAGEHRVRTSRALSRTKSIAEDIPNGITLAWRDISVFAPLVSKGFCGRTTYTGEHKQLVFEVSGAVQPGTLMAIMGASGAGKTTLLNVLTCRNLDVLQIQGHVMVNGEELGAGIKSVSAYVQQSEMFYGHLKVREHLWYQAMLRMDKDVPNSIKEARVEEILHEMGLSRCANEYINSGTSGSEKKILSFASELLNDPPLLFCDEPTTGLDSLMAENVVKVLRDEAAKGKTILCTIHQPSSIIYEMFTHLLLLADGKLIYMGPSDGALPFFEGIGHPCAENYNPAEHFIYVLAVRPTREQECRQRIATINGDFLATNRYAELAKQIDESEAQGSGYLRGKTAQIASQSPYRASLWTQIWVNTWKHWIVVSRDPRLFGARMFQNIFLCTVIGIMYLQQDLNEIGVMNINGAMYNMILNITFFAMMQLNQFISELTLFYREHHNGMYGADAHFISKNLAEIPIFLLITIPAALITYWMVGMYPAFTNFMIYFVVVALVYQFSISLNVYLVGVIAGRTDIAMNVAPPMRMVFMLMGGYFLNDASIPAYLQWLKYLSWQRYGFEIMVVNQWKDVTSLTCTTGAKSANTSSQASSVCYRDGMDVIRSLNFDVDQVWFDVVMLILIGIVYRFLAVGALYYRARERKLRSK